MIVRLFHITPKYNMTAILKEGVRPDKSRGKLPQSWFVDDEHIIWALAHVSARWSVSVDNLIVCFIDAPMQSFYKTRFLGVYVAKERLHITSTISATNYME